MKDEIEVVVDKDGNVTTLLNGKLHSFKDRPSFVNNADNERMWHKNGVFHREGNKPAYIKIMKHKSLGSVEVEIITREWYVDGVFHRDGDKPVDHVKTKRFNKDGKLISKQSIKKWYKNGSIHRDGDKPAMIEKQKKLNLESGDTDYAWDYYFYKSDQEHRDGDKPSYIHNTVSCIDGNTYFYEVVRYCKYGKLHRDGDKPAVTKTEFDNGELILNLECYFINGRNHRDGDKPAYFSFDHAGEVTKFFKMGKLHRCKEPASIIRKEDTVYVEFYSKGNVCQQRNSFFNFYLLNQLKTVSSDFDNVFLGEFPNQNLSSILFAITGVNHINGYPETEGE